MAEFPDEDLYSFGTEYILVAQATVNRGSDSFKSLRKGNFYTSAIVQPRRDANREFVLKKVLTKVQGNNVKR